MVDGMGHFLGALMKHKTSDLTGEKLNMAVHRALEASGQEVMTAGFPGLIAYSTSWSLAGPIIERERIGTLPVMKLEPSDKKEKRRTGYAFTEIPNGWVAGYRPSITSNFDWVGVHQAGPTQLIAAMRAYVAHKLGDEVEL